MDSMYKYAKKRGVVVVDRTNTNIQIEIDAKHLLPESDPLFRSMSAKYRNSYDSLAAEIPNQCTAFLLLIRINNQLHTFFVNGQKTKHFSATESEAACWLLIDACRRKAMHIPRSDIETTAIQSDNNQRDQELLLLFFALARSLGKTRTFGLSHIKRNCAIFLTKLINSPDSIFRDRKKKS